MKKLFYTACIVIVAALEYCADLLEDALGWTNEQSELSKRINKGKDKW
jgi:hypothetical protein